MVKTQRTAAICLMSCIAATSAQAQGAHGHGSHLSTGQVQGLKVGEAAEIATVAKGLSVVAPWSRATPGQSKNGAVFLEVKSDRTDKLLNASGAVADAIEIHTHINDNGIMQMRRVDAVDIAEGSTKFVPGGYHIMLLGLKQPLKAGETFKLTLTFETAGTREVDVTVRSNTAAPAKGHTH
jgi:periplasmic copper chaperone A